MPYPLVPLFDTRIRVIDSSAEPTALVRAADIDSRPMPVAGDRPKGSKRPHSQATIAAVRHLIEETTLTYEEIVAKTGVANGTISRWTHDFGWQRHPFAPVATDTLPTARAGRKLKLRTLRNRLHLLAERCAIELWNDSAVDLDRLLQAMRVLKAARHDYMSHRRPRRGPDSPAYTGQEWADREIAIREALKEMRRGGIEIERIPNEAMALLDDKRQSRGASTHPSRP